jgi:hypothetical protein
VIEQSEPVCLDSALDPEEVKRRTDAAMDELVARGQALGANGLHQGWQIMALLGLLKELGFTDDAHFLRHFDAERMRDLERNAQSSWPGPQPVTKLHLPGKRPRLA